MPDWDILTDAADYAIYRDGEQLVALKLETKKEFCIKKDTFFDNYYKKRM